MFKLGNCGGHALTRIAAVVVALGVTGSALAISQSGEQRNMVRVGHSDLQGRPRISRTSSDIPTVESSPSSGRTADRRRIR